MYLNVGGQNYSLSSLNPVGAIAASGAIWSKIKDDAIQAMEAGESFSNAATDAGFQYVREMGNLYLQSSFFSGLADFAAAGDDVGDLGATVLQTGASQLIPAFVRHAAIASDPYVRETSDPSKWKAAINKGFIQYIPALRQLYLAPKVDITGKEVMSKEGAQNFFNFFYTTKVSSDKDTIDGLLALSDELQGDTSFLPSLLTATSITGGRMNNYQLADMRKLYGSLVFDGGDTVDSNGNAVHITGIRELMATSAWQEMTPTEQANQVKAIVSAASAGVKATGKEQYGFEKPKTVKDTDVKRTGIRPGYIDNMSNGFALETLYQLNGMNAEFMPDDISYTFTKNGVSYTVPEDERDAFHKIFIAQFDTNLTELFDKYNYNSGAVLQYIIDNSLITKAANNAKETARKMWMAGGGK